MLLRSMGRGGPRERGSRCYACPLLVGRSVRVTSPVQRAHSPGPKPWSDSTFKLMVMFQTLWEEGQENSRARAGSVQMIWKEGLRTAQSNRPLGQSTPGQKCLVGDLAVIAPVRPKELKHSTVRQ